MNTQPNKPDHAQVRCPNCGARFRLKGTLRIFECVKCHSQVDPCQNDAPSDRLEQTAEVRATMSAHRHVNAVPSTSVDDSKPVEVKDPATRVDSVAKDTNVPEAQSKYASHKASLTKHWYVTRSGLQIGPLSDDQVKDLFSHQQLAPTDLVWREGMSNWTEVGSTPSLARFLSAKVARVGKAEEPAANTEQAITTQSPQVNAVPIAIDTRSQSNTRRNRIRKHIFHDIAVIAVLLTGIGIVLYWNFKQRPAVSVPDLTITPPVLEPLVVDPIARSAIPLAVPRVQDDLPPKTVPNTETVEEMLTRVKRSIVRVECEGMLGSGVIVATNLHVVEHTRQGNIIFADGTSFNIEGFVYFSVEHDLCLLKFNSGSYQLFPLPVATSLPQQGLTDQDFGSSPFWLHLRKQGTIYSTYFTLNGSVFQQASSSFSFGDGTPAKLGFVAMVDPTQSAHALIDSFTVTTVPEPASMIATILGGACLFFCSIDEIPLNVRQPFRITLSVNFISQSIVA